MAGLGVVKLGLMSTSLWAYGNAIKPAMEMAKWFDTN
jgi:hypothetical protein